MGSELALLDSNRPYAPPSNVISVLERLRSRNLPDRIDNDYLRDAGIPEGSIHRVGFALRFLGLVENDSPTVELRSISTSTDEEYRDILAGMIRRAYSEVFSVIDPAQDTSDRIVNFFRRYTPASQRDRMVNFFLGMCREAGIPTMDAPRQRVMGSASAVKRPKGTSSKAGKSVAQSGNVQAQRASGSIGEPTGLPAGLELLVRSLPPEGSPLSRNRREQWLEMARATLAFVYPEEPENGSSPEDVEDEA